MKVLIIGANGFLGRHIALQCLTQGWQTHAVYNLNYRFIPKECSRIPISLLDTCHNDYDIVFLTAAHIPYGIFNTPSNDLFETNIHLVVKIVEKFASSRLVFASSVSVYGTNTSTPLTEVSPYYNPTLYGLSKLTGENIVQQHSNYAIVRYSSLYGRGMYQNTFLPQIIKKAIDGGIITLFGTGERRQDYLYITDAANLALAAALCRNNGIFLGVHGESISNLEAAQTVQSCYPLTTITFTGVDTSPSFNYDNTFTQRELGFSPQYSFQSGIKELCSNEL